MALDEAAAAAVDSIGVRVGRVVGDVAAEESPGRGKALVAAGIAAAVAVGRRARGSTLGGLRAVAVAFGLRSRRMLQGRMVGARISLGSSSGRCAMERTGKRAESSGVMTGDAGVAFETDAVSAVLQEVVVVVDIAAAEQEHDFVAGKAGVGSGDRVFPVAVGCRPATFCSCRDRLLDTGLDQVEVASIRQSHPVVEEVRHSCRIAAHYQSNSFPCHLESSLAQLRCWDTCLID